MSVNPAVDSNGPFQYVPVPNEHVPAVLAFIADLLSPVAVPAVRTSSDPLHSASAAEAAADWLDEQLVQFFLSSQLLFSFRVISDFFQLLFKSRNLSFNFSQPVLLVLDLLCLFR